MSEKLVEAIRDLVFTMQATNRLLRAEQEWRREKQERAAQRRAEKQQAAQKLLEHQPDAPKPAG